MPGVDFWLEAERRGLLPPDKLEALQEARKRGLVPEALSATASAKSAPAATETPAAAPQPERQTFIGPRDRDTSEILADNTGMDAAYWRRVLYDLKAPARAYQGMMDPFEGTVQAIPHAMSWLSSFGNQAPNALSRFWGDTSQTVDENMRREEERRDFERQAAGNAPGSTDFSRLAGNVASPLTLATGELLAPAEGANLLSKFFAAGRTGAAIGAEQPVYNQDYAAEKAGQTAGGAAAGVGTQGLASLVGPWISADAQRLMQQYGVTKLTTGQISPIPFAGRLEEAQQSVPLSGLVVRAARNTANEDLNRQVANHVLQPIGESLDAGTSAGRDAMAEVNSKISDAYNAVIPNLRGRVDADLQNDIAQIRASLPERVRADFDDAVQRNLLSKQDQAGNLIGQDVKFADRDLRDESIRRIQNPRDTDDYLLGTGLRDVRDSVRDMWTRHSAPEDIEALNAADRAYGSARVMERASSYVGAPDGIFNANQFLSAVKAQDNTLGKRAFTEGGARMQDFAELAKGRMGNTLADSGTPERALGIGAVADAVARPGDIPIMAAGLGTHAAIYSTPGQWALRGLMTGGIETRSAMQTALEQITPGVTAVMAYSRPYDSGAKSVRDWQAAYEDRLNQAKVAAGYYGFGQ